ncbi:M48 family metalloprotease [Nocardia sp. NPDC050717]|uniref:M48 family metalloprotease n=1 Tax=Nocardia sp. NPDC050717 TaxID=3157221 RepID=UPI0033C6A1D5
MRDVLSTHRSRWAETHADRVAVALGYGHDLRESLTIAEIDCATGPTITDLVPGWMNTHPSHERRLAAIDDELRRRQQR